MKQATLKTYIRCASGDAIHTQAVINFTRPTGKELQVLKAIIAKRNAGLEIAQRKLG